MNTDKVDTENKPLHLTELLCAVADGDVIGFRYKGNRFVKGKIVGTYPTGFLIELKTDYIGKNDEWFIGEKKFFNRKEMKKVSR